MPNNVQQQQTGYIGMERSNESPYASASMCYIDYVTGSEMFLMKAKNDNIPYTGTYISCQIMTQISRSSLLL